jgi:hypothetical protein
VIHPSESARFASLEMARFFLPDYRAVQAWWDTHQHRYQHDQRYLFGQEASLENCLRILGNGRQYQREAVALELSLLKDGLPVLDTQAASFRQSEWISQMETEPLKQP